MARTRNQVGVPRKKARDMTPGNVPPAAMALLHSPLAEIAAGPRENIDQADVLPAFARRERADLGFSHEQVQAVDPPQWVYELFRTGASNRVILERLLEHIRRAPSHKLHLLAESVLNEVMERPGGRQAIEALLTEPLLVELGALDATSDDT